MRLSAFSSIILANYPLRTLQRHATSLIGAAKIMAEGIDSRLIGDQYWSYFRGMQNQPYFKEALLRPYVSCAAGTLLAQHAGNKMFEAT